jgi:DNA-directed RNA polymerase III subunit RPC1
LVQVAAFIKEVYLPDQCYLLVKLDLRIIKELYLEIDADSIRRSILESKLKLKDKHVWVQGADQLRIFPIDTNRQRMLHNLQVLKQGLLGVVVKGLKEVNRCIIVDERKDSKESKAALALGPCGACHCCRHGNASSCCTRFPHQYVLKVEGSDLRGVMGVPGVCGRLTDCNHIMEVEKRLGIEAARQTIVMEINSIMSHHSLLVDNRHLMLLADVMCYQGEVFKLFSFFFLLCIFVFCCCTTCCK